MEKVEKGIDIKYIMTYGHSSFQLGDKLYKMMGCMSENKCLNDYLIFCYSDKEWKYV